MDYASMGEKTRYAMYILAFYEDIAEVISNTIEVPDNPRKKRKFIRRFILKAVHDKLADMSQEGE